MKTQNFKPILFSTEMVQAILAGRKTQTRRVIKADFPENSTFIGCRETLGKSGVGFYWCDGTTGPMQGFFPGLFEDLYPKYQPGDILWVRETFIESKTPDIPNNRGWSFSYKADGGYGIINWKPSLFMPKEAARIFLKVTDVRVERLQDISEEDAIAEGVSIVYDYGSFVTYKNYLFKDKKTYNKQDTRCPKESFQSLWQSINGKKHPWESNPWVWVYEFERIEKPENFLL